MLDKQRPLLGLCKIKRLKAKTAQTLKLLAEVRALMDRLKLSLGSPVNIKFRAGKRVQGKLKLLSPLKQN